MTKKKKNCYKPMILPDGKSWKFENAQMLNFKQSQNLNLMSGWALNWPNKQPKRMYSKCTLNAQYEST